MALPNRTTLLLISLILPIVQPLFAAPRGGPGEPYTLRNGFVHLDGADGNLSTFRIDPEGKGQYGRNWITVLRVGDRTLPPGGDFRWEIEGTTLRLHSIPVARIQSRELGKPGGPAFPLWPNKRLGQRFRVEFPHFVRAGGFFPTWCTTDSGFTLTLRRNDPEGEMITRQDFRNVSDGAEQYVTFDPQPPGVYYLEMSDPVGTPGWWYNDGRISEEETAIITGAVADEATNFTFRTHIYGYRVEKADWTIALEANHLTWSVRGPRGTDVQLVTPWIKDGYQTDDPEQIVFTRFLGDNGVYRPVHQFKRCASENLTVSGWIDMASPAGFNLRFLYPGGGTLAWRMDADSMMFPFDRSEMTWEIRPHDDGPPEGFPVFFSSSPSTDTVLNQFLFSHAFNFGAGCFPDWKEWQSRILCWTTNPQKDVQARFLAKEYPIRPDGYVHTWGDQEGWPFPFKDDDGDGKNDYDTRHFTTNAGFILGCANHALWSRDREFVKASLPRARAAMEFQLKDLQGEHGILIITAKGHEGRQGDIGSNYWDILPFGYKDAFANSYYYASLEAMARLEELAASMGFAAGDRTPEFYRKLRHTVRDGYQRTFWDDEAGRFVGCVDVDGVAHDYGFTWVNTEAIAYGLADPEQVKRIYEWMEAEPTATGEADTYTRWIFAPRSATLFDPPFHLYNWKDKLTPTDLPPWWFFGWHMSDYEDQCQSGGAILYTSYYDVVARARFLGADNAFERFNAILHRYAEPDHLSGGGPLYRGETSQGHGIPGSVGVESEFPESGLVPCSFLYAFLGIEPDAAGLRIRPNLPAALDFAGVRNLSFAGRVLEIRVTHDTVSVRSTDHGPVFSAEETLAPGESFLLSPAAIR